MNWWKLGANIASVASACAIAHAAHAGAVSAAISWSTLGGIVLCVGANLAGLWQTPPSGS